MDRILENQLSTFCSKNNIKQKENPSTKFEHFVNYLYFVSNCPSAYSMERDTHIKVHTGKGGDDGLDGIMIVINEIPVFTLEQAKDIISNLGPRTLNVDFYFTQAKTSSSFDIGDMLKTKRGVLHFFTKIEPTNKDIRNFWKIQDYIIKQAGSHPANITCNIGYATAGKWVANYDQKLFVEETQKELSDLNLFCEVNWESIDAKALQRLYNNLNSAIQKQIAFEKRTTFPTIEGVSQSYVGLVDGKNFIELITLDGRLNKAVFYENVRAYLGENFVNKEIAETINNKDTRYLFPILNNGITIVAREMQFIGDNLKIQDFQIVNGCQTSNILYDSRDLIEGMMIPVKIIASENQEIINMIIRSTNRQTPVPTEAFESIKEIHKVIQHFYETYRQSDRIYYERRTREYDKNNRDTEIKSNQVFTIPMQLMSHVAMFLDAPHLSEHEYYGKILETYKKELFQDTDLPIVYYTSARTLYKVENWIHSLTKGLKKKIKHYRFYYLMIIRRLHDKNKEKLKMNSHTVENLCQTILNEIEDSEKFKQLIKASTDILLDCATKTVDSHGNMNHQKLTENIIQHFNS